MQTHVKTKDNTTLTEETDDNEMKIGMDDKNKIINMIKNINIL